MKPPLTPAQFKAVLKAMVAPGFKFRRALVERLQATVVLVGKRNQEYEAMLKATAAIRGGMYRIPEQAVSTLPQEAELKIGYDRVKHWFEVGVVVPAHVALRQGLIVPGPGAGRIIH